MKDFEHISLHLSEQVFERIGKESNLIQIDIQLVYLLLHARFAVVYIIAYQMTEIEEIVSYFAAQIYLHKHGVNRLCQFCIFILDSLNE